MTKPQSIHSDSLAVAFLSDSDHGGGIATQAHLLSEKTAGRYAAKFGPLYRLDDISRDKVLCCSSFRALAAASMQVLRRGAQAVTFVSYHHETISVRRKGRAAPLLRLVMSVLGSSNVAGYDTSTVEALPSAHPVPIGLLGPEPKASNAPWSARKTRVVAPARFVDFKFPGLEALIEAASKFPEVEFVFVGTGPKEAALRQLAAKCPNVHFLGLLPYERLLAQIADARLCMAMGTTILDALAMGTPVLVNQADTRQFMLLADVPYPNYGDVLTGLTQGEGDLVAEVIRSVVLREPNAESATYQLLNRNNSLVLKNYHDFFHGAKPVGRLRAITLLSLIALAKLVMKGDES